jgi:hypothetical protein
MKTRNGQAGTRLLILLLLVSGMRSARAVVISLRAVALSIFTKLLVLTPDCPKLPPHVKAPTTPAMLPTASRVALLTIKTPTCAERPNLTQDTNARLSGIAERGSMG